MGLDMIKSQIVTNMVSYTVGKLLACPYSNKMLARWPNTNIQLNFLESKYNVLENDMIPIHISIHRTVLIYPSPNRKFHIRYSMPH